MRPTGIIVLLACKSCSASFESVPNFIEHKRLNHFVEFQNTAVILFEEKPGKPCDPTLPQNLPIQRKGSKFPALQIISNIPFPSRQQPHINDCNRIQQNSNNKNLFQEELEQCYLSRPDLDLESNAFQTTECNSNVENNPLTAPFNLSDDPNNNDDPDIEVMETDILTEKIDQGHVKNATKHILENDTRDFPIRYNPFVLTNRLTPAEIQAVHSTNNNYSATNITKSNSDLFEENPNDQTKTNIETQKNSSNSGDLDLAMDDSEERPITFAETFSESECNFDPETNDFFIEPIVEITVLDDAIDVDLNVNGIAWGESTATTSTAGTGPGGDAAYEEFLLRYSPFVPLKRLTPQEIEDAAAGKLGLLHNSLPPLGIQLQAYGNQEEEDEDEYMGELGVSLLNSTGTGSRFLDDLYEVNFNERGHIVFKPNVDRQNLDPPLSETSIVCSLCKFVTDSKVSLKNHMKIHSKTLMCSHVDCFASFDTRPSLQQHYSVWHSPLKPYRCPYDDCYKAYGYPTDLKVHYLDHSGERPFRCRQENCSAEFKTKQHIMEYHTSSAHAEERSFNCPKKGCLGSFFNVQLLKAHLRKHPVRRYSCSIPHCKRRFSSWAGSQAHMKKDFHSESTAWTPPKEQ